MGETLASALRLTVRRTQGGPGGGSLVSVAVRVPADVRCIEEAVELMARHCFTGREASNRTRFRFRVLLAEALTNGILFGSFGDPNRFVTVGAELSDEAIRLEVTDDGPGFDPDEVPDPTTPDALERPIGRGLFLIRTLADSVTFNEQGNTIWMTLPRC